LQLEDKIEVIVNIKLYSNLGELEAENAKTITILTKNKAIKDIKIVKTSGDAYFSTFNDFTETKDAATFQVEALYDVDIISEQEFEKIDNQISFTISPNQTEDGFDPSKLISLVKNEETKTYTLKISNSYTDENNQV